MIATFAVNHPWIYAALLILTMCALAKLALRLIGHGMPDNVPEHIED